MQDDLDRLAHVHSLLGSPTRLAFVRALASGPKSGTVLGELTGVSLSAVSQHMGKLKEGGLVGWSRDPNRRQVILFHLIEPHHALVAVTIGLLLPPASTLPGAPPRRPGSLGGRRDPPGHDNRRPPMVPRGEETAAREGSTTYPTGRPEARRARHDPAPGG